MVLFFVDETFQTVDGKKVGALGAVAIPATRYNRFAGWVFKAKRDHLNASELHESELKGNSYFAKSVFNWSATNTGPNPMLAAVDELVDALVEHDARVFALWTDQPDALVLRTSDANQLTRPYIELLARFKTYMQARPTEKRGLLHFDQLGQKADLRAACSIQNYIVRISDNSYRMNFVQIPVFTHSSISPGLQVADLVAYLAAQQVNPSIRPELRPWWNKFAKLGHGKVKGSPVKSIGPV